MGIKVGYARVSTAGQKLDVQLFNILAAIGEFECEPIRERSLEGLSETANIFVTTRNYLNITAELLNDGALVLQILNCSLRAPQNGPD
jgi:hypothetical protein